VPRFRNLTSAVLFVPDVNKTVGPDETVEVPGDLVVEHDDAYEIRQSDGQSRVWPKETWADATPAKRSSKKDEE
jgi:hypothetical protein